MARYIVIDHAFSENIELAKRVHDAVRAFSETSF